MTIFPATPAFAALNAKRISGEFTETQFFNAQWELAVETGIKTRDEMFDAYALLKYTVTAGKYEQWNGETEENCKYSESFVCLEDAIKEHEKNKSYPWSRILLQEGDFSYEIEATRMFRKREGSDGVKRFEPCDFDGTFFNEDA